MSILTRLFFRSRDKPANALPGGAFSFLFGGSSSGKTVNERTAMQTTAVYACVRILAETVAGLSLHSNRQIHPRLYRRETQIQHQTGDISSAYEHD